MDKSVAPEINNNRIHLLEKKVNYVRIDDVENTWESSGWKVAVIDAERLVGGSLYLHKAKSSRSFLGGRILSQRVETEGEFSGKTTFTFHFELAFKDVRAGSTGWGMDKKLVFPTNKPEQPA